MIGANCTQTHIVTILVHPGFEGRARNVDLYTDRYLSNHRNCTVGLVDLDEHGHCICRYPYGAAREQPYHWSIFDQPIRVSTLNDL